ncbi:hypothetical protein GQ457_07G037710 [Hibiscus cannabinus]
MRRKGVEMVAVVDGSEEENKEDRRVDEERDGAAEAASELIRASVEPILEQYTPAILSSMKFDKLTLGTVAPQFTGISIIESESGTGGITLEMDMQWDGDPNIVLNINTRLGVTLPVQVKDIGFTGVFRLILKPLVDQFPCFGAIAYSLREKRALDFTLKVVGGDLSSLPGVSDAIEETIRNAIEDSITWPVRNIVQIIPGDYSDLELKPVGTLDVKLVQAKELTNKDLIGKSDPFAILFIRPLPDKTKTSKTIDNQLNPIWNEHFEFIVEDLSTQHLTVKILDNEGVQNAELLGCAQVALKDLEPGKVKEVWLKLVKDLVVQRDNKYRGQVQIELVYNPYGTESSLKNPFDADYSLTSLEKALKPPKLETDAIDPGKAALKKKDVIVRGVLSVMVISGEDLPPVDLNGKADPFVILSMKKSEARAKTRVANETLNPVWNQTFDFVVEDALHEMLILEVMDHDTFRKGYSLPRFLGRQIINYKIYQVAYAIETEIQAYFDRESVQNLVGTLEESADEDEKVKVLVEFEKRLSRALISMSSCCSIRVLSLLIKFIRIPLVDELEAHKGIPRIISLLSSENVGIQAEAIDCILGIAYYGRREAIEAMLEAGLVEKLVELQGLEKRSNVDENGTANEECSKSDPKMESEEEGHVRNCPFEGCVARFAVQLESGEMLSKKERTEFKLEILRIVREASVSEAEIASIVAEVLWGSSP